MSTPGTIDDEATPTIEATRRTRAGAGTGPIVIEARRISKSFQIPENRVDTFKERATHPFTRAKYRQLRALEDVSFEVHKGEFFGIVGRNGSGKSTLLKILASIYRATTGTVRMAGRMAPFIELGVGFNPELTARENVVLNGVLFGLTRREAQMRLDAVLDFAELRDFTDLKIKNYSSGMMVRLAFAIMVQADADIMLIDEVLAVGDAAFAQKCMDVFYQRRQAGKTIVLVTHDMATVHSLCHRAMLLHDGEMHYIGDPEDAALRYYRLNFAHEAADDGEGVKAPFDDSVAVHINVRAVHGRLLSQAGEPVANVEEGTPLILDLMIEAARELDEPVFLFHVVNADHAVVFGFERMLASRVAPGQRVRLSGEIENRLVPGRYFVDLWIRRQRQAKDVALQCLRVLQFVVYGTGEQLGVVSLQTDVEPVLETDSER
jgi:ABC-2 type transport system ATP-binding protein